MRRQPGCARPPPRSRWSSSSSRSRIGAHAVRARPAFVRPLHRGAAAARRRAAVAEGIMLARSEAVKRNRHVVICATTPLARVRRRAHWHEGWVMFEDVDGNAEQDAGDLMVGNDVAASAGVTMIGNRPVERYLRFDYTGPGAPGQRRAADGHDRGLQDAVFAATGSCSRTPAAPASIACQDAVRKAVRQPFIPAGTTRAEGRRRLFPFAGLRSGLHCPLAGAFRSIAGVNEENFHEFGSTLSKSLRARAAARRAGLHADRGDDRDRRRRHPDGHRAAAVHDVRAAFADRRCHVRHERLPHAPGTVLPGQPLLTSTAAVCGSPNAGVTRTSRSPA